MVGHEGIKVTPDELESRARTFALRCMRVVDALPLNASGRSVGQQLVRSATSVYANYRATRRGRSDKEFLAKLSIVVEEVDEAEMWLGLIADAGLLPSPRLASLRKEAGELMRIFAASRKTASGKRKPPST
ncbi:MAG: four helix bundle protein [Planctomycetota bacterium]